MTSPPLFYPKPDRVPAWPPVNPRTLLPISHPPERDLKELVYLPLPQRRCPFDHLYTLSTHLVPAAYPRVSPDVLYTVDLDDTDKGRKKQKLKKATRELIELHERHSNGEFDAPNEKVLWNCVNRYVRKDLNKGWAKGLTLFCAHATGFPKEIWEPVLHHLVTRLESIASAPKVDEIWCWEATTHGDAALLNEGRLSALYDWQDNSRDISNFLLNYLPSAPSPSILPTKLPLVSPSEASSRPSQGFRNRKLVAMGHSFGGTTVALAACYYPRLFDSVILLDPAILPPGRHVSHIQQEMVGGALGRREQWSSLEEAYASYMKNPYFVAWDPEILKIYLECGLYDDPNGGVRLKTSSFQEGVCLCEVRVPFETFELLGNLDERVELRWVMPGTDKPYEMGGPENRPFRAWRRPENSSNVRIPGTGHLIPQEAPKALAEDVFAFLQRRYGSNAARL